jgi:hypothetical protein
MTKRAVTQITLALALAAGVTGCSARTYEGPDSAIGTPSPGRTLPFDLYTHCGIDEALIGTTYFEAQTPLSDGSGNPPAGWDNPSQHGTMTLTPSGTRAVFTDDAGHKVAFRARPRATAFKTICA